MMIAMFSDTVHNIVIIANSREVVNLNYSYERVSTVKQDEKRQQIALSNIKIDKRYLDKQTGKNADRPELNKLKLTVKKGDNIYIESISRLGRNVENLRELCEYFTEKGATVHFIKEGFNTHGNSYKFMLTILGAVAEMERELIVERVREGIVKAKIHGTKSGKPIGRPERILPDSFEKYYKRWKAKEITGIEFSKLLGVSRATLYRYIKEYEV
jgi:DNA invertase Pin-like site-specific DNA recombinase